MIYKSHIVEQNIGMVDKNFALFYGENLGMINDLKVLIKKFNKKSKIIRLNEEEIIKDNLILVREVSNKSLFEEEKIILVDQVTDKILNLILELEEIESNTKIYLFTGILEKKSKLRSYFEKSKNACIIPCYEDNETNLRAIIKKSLKDFGGMTPQNINIILENCNLSRSKLNNELEKIKGLFLNKVLDTEKLEKLLNLKTNENFDMLKDSALLGNKKITNKLLGDTQLEEEKNIYYLNIINQRLRKLLEINNISVDIERTVNDMKPPIFWKDKPKIVSQAKVWNKEKLKTIMKDTYNIEILIKNNSSINKQILIKKLLVDVCTLANA